ncbi:ImmA/IrrE family metallo-endopeptidase [Arthrobacter pascens]|uniref:ImmA/IrrE family metallo-endopeptidase n=1 Tax=Arthrobacter pascens TaxID=1677 RepID=UPI0027D781CC|nr:ImmA/IrrE family metallo-endopeptidase [Arthrobacter pascens]
MDWPIERVDAVLTGLTGDPRKIAVYIRATDNLLRERFTMAHELGHLLLPWHLPSANCEVGEGALDLPTFSLEEEADVFASCLLVPDAWLLHQVDRSGDDMSQLLRELNAAEVTTAAALQALRRYLLAGWVFVSYGERQRIMPTRGTRLPNVPADKLVEVLASECFAHGEASLNGFPVYWYQMVEPLALPEKNIDDPRSDHQILMDAIAMVEPDLQRRNSIGMSANGKVGGALREAAGRPAIETFQAVRHRCEQWEHSTLLAQPDFLLWLAERSRAVETGMTKRRRSKS